MKKECRVVLHRINLKKFEGMKEILLSFLVDEGLCTQTHSEQSTRKEVEEEEKVDSTVEKETSRPMTRSLNQLVVKQTVNSNKEKNETTSKISTVDESVATTLMNTQKNNTEKPNKKRRIEFGKVEVMSKTKTRTRQLQIKRRNAAPSFLSLRPALHQYEFVWTKIKGYSNWPGIIQREIPKGKFTIHFFGDYMK